MDSRHNFTLTKILATIPLAKTFFFDLNRPDFAGTTYNAHSQSRTVIKHDFREKMAVVVRVTRAKGHDRGQARRCPACWPGLQLGKFRDKGRRLDSA